MLKAGFDGDVRMLASLPYIEQVVIRKLELCVCMQGTGSLKKKHGNGEISNGKWTLMQLKLTVYRSSIYSYEITASMETHYFFC